MHQTVEWADTNERRWAFTASNAGAYYFKDFSDLSQLNQLDWQAIRARDWRECREDKQAEFLIERSFPWRLITGIGVESRNIGNRVLRMIQASKHRPPVQIKPGWYY